MNVCGGCGPRRTRGRPELAFTAPEPDAFLLTLPGERRHRTLVWLLVGDHDLLVESFVCRQPDENHQPRCTDTCCSAMHLYGRLRTASIVSETSIWSAESVWPRSLADEIDTLVGVVLATSDADFNPILQRGFPSSIRREWAWRSNTGQSLKNLEAFRHLIEQSS